MDDGTAFPGTDSALDINDINWDNLFRGVVMQVEALPERDVLTTAAPTSSGTKTHLAHKFASTRGHRSQVDLGSTAAAYQAFLMMGSSDLMIGYSSGWSHTTSPWTVHITVAKPLAKDTKRHAFVDKDSCHQFTWHETILQPHRHNS